MTLKVKKGGFSAHQGDVQFYELTELPADAKKVKKTFFAKSEKSGHAHAACGDYELYELPNGGFALMVGPNGALLNHTRYENLTETYWDVKEKTPIADHKPTELPAGTILYADIQRKYNPFERVWRRVID